MVRQITQKRVMDCSQIQFSKTMNTNEGAEQTHMLIFPYKGKKGKHALRSINREINRNLPENKKAQVI